MRSIKSKKLISVVLSVLMIVSVIVPGTVFSVAAAESYPAPILSTNPELLKEFATPDVTIPVTDFSESFAPSFSGSVAADAPKIATVTAQAGPNDSITLTGTEFLGASVYAFGLIDGEGVTKELKQTVNTKDTINAIIDYTFDYSMYIVWVKSASGKMSAPVRVNAPELTWKSLDAISAGKDLSVYGKFLTTNNADGEDAETYVFVTGGSKYYKATVKEANPYKLTVTIPEGLANGNYKIWVHNGHGGNYGWSNPLSFEIEAGVENIWTGTTRTVTMPSSKKTTWNAVKNVINAAKDYDTILLPAGDYYFGNNVSSYGYIEKKLRFIGETDAQGNPLARIIVVATKDGGTDSVKAGATALRIRHFPSEFRNIIFMDNIDPNALADPSQYDIEYSHANFIYATGEKAGVSHDHFVLEGCKFVTRRTAGGEETATETYADLEARYTFGDVNDINASRYSKNVAVSRPVWVSGLTHATVTNNYVKAPLGIDTSGCEYAFVTNNTLEGVWIQRNVHQGGCLRDFSSSNLDMSGNIVRGRDYFTDDSGILTTNDQTFGRGIVIQTPNKSDDNLYIADNDLERVGQSNINAGELILFEDLTTLYKGKMAAISADTKTITLDTKSASKNWEAKWQLKNGEYYMYGYAAYGQSHIDGKLIVQSHNPRRVIGQRIVIANGTGVGQWRTIVGATADSITVDRPWDVAPDSTSYLFMAPVCEDVVMFRNRITGYKNVNENYNSTIGIQAYETMLDTIADRNLFENVAEGVAISCHWDNRIYAGAYTRSDNTGSAVPVDLIEEDVQADYGVNVFAQFVNMNNTIRNARYGYSMPAIVYIDGKTSSDDDFSNADAHIRFQTGTVIRNNKLENIVYSTNIKTDHLGKLYNTFEYTSGIAFNIGKYLPEPDISRQPMTNEIYLSEIVIENNTSRAVDVHNIVMGYQQKNIVFRNNDFENQGRETEFVKYPPKPSKNTDKYTINPIVYHSDYGTSADGMHISADSVESTPSFLNGDFEQGLKYWADAAVKTTASGVAKIVTEGDNEYLEITSKSGIKSVGFHADCVKSGEKYAFIYDIKGSHNAKVTLSGRGLVKASNNSRSLMKAPTASGFIKKITDYVIISEALDPTIVDINCIIEGDGKNKSYIDNIELVRIHEDKGYLETLDGEKLYLYDGQVFGGSEADGMIIGNIQPNDLIANNDFSEGLKFWSNIGGTELASTKATVQNGVVTFNKGTGNGIMSAPFRVSADKLSGAESENCAAVIVGYTGTSTDFRADLYVNGSYSASSSGTGNTTLKYRVLYFSNVKYNANDTYQVAIYSNSSTATISIDYVDVARYKNTAAFLDLATGIPYNTSGAMTAPTNATTAPILEFANNDFSSGLDFWVKASGTATVADGKVTLTAGKIQNVYFDPHLENGDSIAVLYRYKKGDATAKISLSQRTISGTSASNSNKLTQTISATADTKLAVTNAVTYAMAAGTQSYLSVILEGTAEFDYVSIVKVESDKNLYTDIITGERYSMADLSVYGGTEQGMDPSIPRFDHKNWVTDLQDNLDFANGLKYWRSISTSNPITNFVSVEDNTLVFDTAKMGNDGIVSAAFKFPAHALGKKVTLLFDGRFKCPELNASGNTMSIARACLETSSGAILEGDVNLTMSWFQNTNNEWRSYATRVYTLTDVEKTYAYSIVSNDAFDAQNNEMAIKNLHIAFVDEGGMANTYYNLDGSPIGTIYGDANKDGLVNIIDLARMANYLVGEKDVNIFKAAANLDKDLDNALSATDIALLKEYIVSGVKNF